MKNEGNKVVMYKGKYIKQLTREELIDALNHVYFDLSRYKEQHSKDLEILGK